MKKTVKKTIIVLACAFVAGTAAFANSNQNSKIRNGNNHAKKPLEALVGPVPSECLKNDFKPDFRPNVKSDITFDFNVNNNKCENNKCDKNNRGNTKHNKHVSNRKIRQEEHVSNRKIRHEEHVSNRKANHHKHEKHISHRNENHKKHEQVQVKVKSKIDHSKEYGDR